MEELKMEKLDEVNGGSLIGDITWGAAGGAIKGGMSGSEFGVPGIIGGAIAGGAMGALGTIEVSAIRHAIGWN